jgi:hypothetical protein
LARRALPSGVGDDARVPQYDEVSFGEDQRVWSFEGSGNSIVFSEQSRGHFLIYGDLLSQDCRIAVGPLHWLDDVSKAQLDFRLIPPDADETDSDVVGFDKPGLFERFRADPKRSHGMISYLPEEGRPEQAWLTVNVILSDKSVQRVFEMYKKLFGRSDLFHRISIDFNGLLETSHTDLDKPSVAEFMNPDLLNRKAYFNKSVRFSFRSASQASG